MLDGGKVGEVSKVKPRIAIILLICGLLLAFSPFLFHYYYLYKNQKEMLETQEKITPVEPGSNAIEDSEIPAKLVQAPGVLEITALGLKVNVGYGVDDEELKQGPGFYPQSGYPDNGNVAIAGHRNTHGSPFINLHRLKTEDQIILYYRDKKYTYAVDKVFETHSRDWSVIDPTPEAALTLTTCTPIIKPPGGEYNRLIVRARLIDSKKMTGY